MSFEQTIGLADLFKNSFFRIPDYQRGYAWERRQLEDFWDDILELQWDSDKKEYRRHYTGTIFLEEFDVGQLKDSENWVKGHFYNVVDGQQRLTTISILLFCLIKLKPDGYGEDYIEDIKKDYLYVKNKSGNSKVYRFAYSGEGCDFLFKEIFEDDSYVGSGPTTAYTNNLKNAKRFFLERLSQSEVNLEEIFSKVSESLRFDVRYLSEEFDVQAVFETMNNRGKPLTVLEKLKNRLIYLSTMLKDCPLEDKHNLRTMINDSWGCIYKELARSIDNPLDEDEFITAHLSVFREPPLKQGYYVFTKEMAEVKLFEMFCNKAEKYSVCKDSEEKEGAVSYDKIKDYALAISKFAITWQKINNNDDELIQKIFKLNSSLPMKIFLCALYENIYTLS